MIMCTFFLAFACVSADQFYAAKAWARDTAARGTKAEAEEGPARSSRRASQAPPPAHRAWRSRLGCWARELGLGGEEGREGSFFRQPTYLPFLSIQCSQKQMFVFQKVSYVFLKRMYFFLYFNNLYLVVISKCLKILRKFLRSTLTSRNNSNYLGFLAILP